MKIHKESIAKARNQLGEVIGRARYGDEVTILLNRDKEVAAVVSIEFLNRAIEALEITVDE
jgi:prevent-host-death family protein